MTVAAVITAAGMGTRLGSPEPKALVLVAGQSLLAWAIQHTAPVVDAVVVTAPATHIDEVRRAAQQAITAFPFVSLHVVAGGESRQDSVSRGLQALTRDGLPNVMLVHDAARAFMPTTAIRRAIQALGEGVDGVVPTLPVADTLIARPAEDGTISGSVDRDSVRLVQTPQVFRGDVLLEAHGWAEGRDDVFTDDASIVRAAGYRVVSCDGDQRGFKVTFAPDLVQAEALARAADTDLTTGTAPSGSSIEASAEATGAGHEGTGA